MDLRMHSFIKYTLGAMIETVSILGMLALSNCFILWSQGKFCSNRRQWCHSCLSYSTCNDWQVVWQIIFCCFNVEGEDNQYSWIGCLAQGTSRHFTTENFSTSMRMHQTLPLLDKLSISKYIVFPSLHATMCACWGTSAHVSLLCNGSQERIVSWIVSFHYCCRFPVGWQASIRGGRGGGENRYPTASS